MKLPVLTFLALLVAAPPIANAAARPVLEVIEEIAKISGKVPSKGAAEALEAAFKTEGDAALKAAASGGIELAEAAAKHGDGVFRAAVRVPDIVQTLGRDADVLMPLAGRYGDDVFKLEAKAPGLAATAVDAFPEKELLARLNDLPANQAKRVIQLSSYATEPAAARALLEGVERKGATVLERLTPAQIRATGLSVAMVTAATSGPIAATALPIAAAGAPGEAADAAGRAITIIGLAVVAVLGGFLCCRFRRPRGAA